MPDLDFELIFNNSPNPYMLLDQELRYVAVNEAYLEVTASSRNELIGKQIFEVFPDDPKDPNRRSAQLLRNSLERVFDTGVTDTLALITYKVPQNTPLGVVTTERFWSATHSPVLDAAGEVAFVLQHTVDVTNITPQNKVSTRTPFVTADATDAQIKAGVWHRAQAMQDLNADLEAERRRLLLLFEQAPGFMCVLRGPQHHFDLANRAYCQLVGNRELVGKPVAEALPEVVEQGFVTLMDQVYREAQPFVGRAVEVVLARGAGASPERAYVDFIYQPVIESDNCVSGIFVQGHDVTEQVLAEEELRSHRQELANLVDERTRALADSQAALQQAQRMESVGRLTGGVAHDFNNLLQVIAGNLQLLQRDTSLNAAAQRRLESASGAVERGAKLASQLLAFARRQPLEPLVVNPGKSIRAMEELVRQAMGETVVVETFINGELWNTFCDPAQLENAVLNLAINARDAMRDGGKLTIEVGTATLDDQYVAAHPDAELGQYAMVAVSDTGCGMSPDVVERAFEPFFSTKAADEGTGLGLSMVYGFVKQTGGHIKIDSEEGVGTSIKIYLPRADHPETDVPDEGLGEPVPRGSEAVLIVEDDDQVRDTVVELLSDLGYKVLRAADGQSALAIVQSGIHIDLLFTDVIMPGPVSSTDLAQQAKNLIPDLEILFTSGYTADTIMHGGRLDPGVKLLSKPYRQADLARKIAHMLRNKRQRSLARAQAVLVAESEQQKSSGLRVLVVEDDADVRNALSEFMTYSGYQVLCKATAESALESLNECAFDVLLTDVTLEGISGLELAAQVRVRFPAMKVIIASGYGPETHDDPSNNYDWLVKPYNFSLLEQALERAP